MIRGLVHFKTGQRSWACRFAQLASSSTTLGPLGPLEPLHSPSLCALPEPKALAVIPEPIRATALQTSRGSFNRAAPVLLGHVVLLDLAVLVLDLARIGGLVLLLHTDSRSAI